MSGRANGLAISLLLAAASAAGALDGLSLGLSTGPLFHAGYYTHDNPGYRGFELGGCAIDASIAYRLGRLEAEVGGTWCSTAGAAVDDGLSPLSASLGFRPRLGLSLYARGPFFLHLGAGLQIWTAKDGQPVTWNRSESISVIARIGLKLPLEGSGRLKAFAFYEFAMDPQPGPWGTRAFSVCRDADGMETVMGGTLVGASNSLAAGIAVGL